MSLFETAVQHANMLMDFAKFWCTRVSMPD